MKVDSSFSSVRFSCSVMSNYLQPHGLQHARLPCPSPSPGVCPISCPLSQGCHSTISSCAITFSSHLQSFPSSGSFPMSQLFASGGQNIRASCYITQIQYMFSSFQVLILMPELSVWSEASWYLSNWNLDVHTALFSDSLPVISPRIWLSWCIYNCWHIPHSKGINFFSSSP